MPRYIAEERCYVGGALREAGEEFYVEKPIITRAKLNKDGKRTGKKVGLPAWIKPVDQSAKDAAADKDSAKKAKEDKQKQQEEQDKELKAAGVGNKKANFMDGEVEQM